jgi:hypothetical protein
VLDAAIVSSAAAILDGDPRGSALSLRFIEPKNRVVRRLNQPAGVCSMLRDGSVAMEASWCANESNDARQDKLGQLHRRLKRIVKARGALDAEEAAALREADALRVWRHYGYSSLLEYMEMELSYTPRQAIERLRVAKAIVDLPTIAQKLQQGELSFSAARELTRVATAETEGEWIEAAADKNVHQVEALVSGHELGDKPTDPTDPKLRKLRLRYEDIDPETKAMLRQARQILECELGDRLDDNAFLRTFARSVIDGAAAPQRTRAPYQIAITICADCKRGQQHGGNITVDMSPAKLEAALCDAQHIGRVDGDAPDVGRDAQHVGGVDGDENRAPHSAPRMKSPTHERPRSAVVRARSDIPPALRRAVRARDHGRCRVPWCRSSRNVDQHHVVPRSEGGTHTRDNLITLCESHHIAHHEGALIIEGTAGNAKFTRRAHSSFAIAERSVETAEALKALGFDRHEVKAAMDKTRTHVGTTELALEQWIKTALRYCPKPRG